MAVKICGAAGARLLQPWTNLGHITNISDRLGGNRTRRAAGPGAAVSRPPGPDRVRLLGVNRHQSVHREELLGAIWPDDAPAQTESGLDAIFSKLRGTLKSADFGPADAGVTVSSGTIALQLPIDALIDLEAAANALDESEGAVRRNDTIKAWSLANIAVVISRRPFLPDVEAPWIESQRRALRALQMRALRSLVTVSARNAEPLLALQHAREMIALEPFRETAYQQVMRMHAAAGDRRGGAASIRAMPRAAPRRARCQPVAADRSGLPRNPSSRMRPRNFSTVRN